MAERSTHLARMSDVLHALASHQGRVEYAGQISGRVGCSEEQVETYVAALRDSGYVAGQLLQPGSTFAAKRGLQAGVSLTMAGFRHVDQHRSHVKDTLIGKPIGED